MSVIDSKLRGGTRLHQSGAYEGRDGPLVSVITAVFNGVGTIRGCIESVLKQDYQQLEHIVIDGGSTDGTIEVLREYENRIALWVSGPDSGVYDAWNKALDLAQGEWIAFLGADDNLLPGAISEYLQLARRNPLANLLTSRARLLHPSGYSPEFGRLWSWPRAARAMPSVHVGAMHHRSIFAQYGQFDATYRIAGDYEFLLRAREDLHAAFMPTVTVAMRAGGLSDSTAGLSEAKRAKLKNNIRGTLLAEIEFCALALRFHVRRMLIKMASFLKLFRGSQHGTLP